MPRRKIIARTTSSTLQTTRVAFALVFLLIIACTGWWASLRHPRITSESEKPLVAFAVNPTFQNDLLPFEERTMDFDADGEKEEGVQLLIQNNEDTEEQEAILSTNTIHFVVPTENVTPRSMFHVASLSTDGIPFVLVGFDGPSGDPSTVFMRWTGKAWVSAGELPGAAENMSFEGNNVVIISERASMPDTWFLRARYRLTASGFERIDQSFYERMDREILTANKTVLLDGEFATLTVHKGEKVRIVGCDNIDKCQVVNRKGQRGWFSLSASGPDLYEAFSGWNMAD